MNKHLISEKDIEIKVVKKLTDLGWYIFDINPDKNVFQQSPRTPEEKAKLGKKKPDFILYSDNFEPLAIIETKKPNGNLFLALKQAEDYAKHLNINIIFAYDGFKIVSKHIKYSKELQYGGTVITDFLPQNLLLKFKENYKINLEFGELINSEDDFIKEMKQIENILRTEGLKAGDERFTEFAKLLFLKLISQSKEEYSTIWTSILNSNRNDIKDIINSKLMIINKEYKVDKYGETIKINSPEVIDKIVKRLDKIDFINTSLDVKGSAFEYFLNYKGKNDDLAQYFTPREIVRFMVEIINPVPGETIYDPFCGSAGILIKAFDYIKSQIPSDDKKSLKFLKEDSLFGSDISSIAYVAKMNMILSGDGHTNITRQEKGSLVNKRTNNYDIVITNIPFTLPINYNVEGMMYNVPSNNGNSISIQHCLDSLKLVKGSRAAIVVPEQVIFSNDLKDTREYIVNNFKVDVFSLPQGVFLPYAIAKSCILYLEYVGEKSGINFIEIREVGFTPNRSKKRIDNNDLYNYIVDDNSVEKITISYEQLKNNNFIFKPNNLNNENLNNENSILMSDIFEFSRHDISLNDNDEYFEITVKNHGLGLVKRTYDKAKNINSLKGSEIKSKRYVIKDEAFMYSTLDARNGGFGKITDNLRGGVYSSTYACFKLKEEYKNLDLDMLTALLSTDKMKNYFTSLSNGTTNRRSVKKDDFLQTKIEISKIKLLEMSNKYTKLKISEENIINELKKIKTLMKNIIE